MPDITGSIGAGVVRDSHLAADAALTLTKLAQRPISVFPILLTDWKQATAMQTNLGTPASTDLGIASGTYGTVTPYISAGDLKAAGATNRKARCRVALPGNYDAGETVTIRAVAATQTHVADVSCTLVFEVYLITAGVYPAANLVATSATTINSTSPVTVDFQVTATTLTPGAELDIRMSIACNDAASVTAVLPSVFSTQLLVDTRG